MAPADRQGFGFDVTPPEHGGPAQPTPMWVSLNVLTTTEWEAAGSALKAGFDDWEAYIAELNARVRDKGGGGSVQASLTHTHTHHTPSSSQMPTSFSNSFHSSKFWMLMAVELEFVRGTMLAIILSVASAFIVSVTFTRRYGTPHCKPCATTKHSSACRPLLSILFVRGDALPTASACPALLHLPLRAFLPVLWLCLC